MTYDNNYRPSCLSFVLELKRRETPGQANAGRAHFRRCTFGGYFRAETNNRYFDMVFSTRRIRATVADFDDKRTENLALVSLGRAGRTVYWRKCRRRIRTDSRARINKKKVTRPSGT